MSINSFWPLILKALVILSLWSLTMHLLKVTSFICGRPMARPIPFSPSSACSLLLRSSLHTSASTQSDQKPTAPEFWEKNQHLQRPVSPWTIYKPQITTILSITHRISGIGLGLPLYAMGIAQLFNNQPWAMQVDALQAACPAAFAAFKLAVIAGISYHTFNGVRHLCWDLGHGFSLKQLYTSGYLVIVLSIAATILGASYCFWLVNRLIGRSIDWFQSIVRDLVLIHCNRFGDSQS